MHSLFSPTVVEVCWIISEPVEVTEGERDWDGHLILLELYAQVFGFYASPIEIGVVCTESIATGVPRGADTTSALTLWRMQLSTTLHLFICSHP